MQNRPKPIIYIAFANDLEHAERNLSGLAVESANIQGALHDLCDQDASWELVPNADCTPAKLVAPFYSDRVAIFHYGGHANPNQILLETDGGSNKAASAPLLAEFLAKQETLKLVFLNACSTREWAENLVHLGVPCVIATSRPVQDEIALKFAAYFYESLACDLTVSEAFEKAVSGIKFTNDGLTRTFDLPDDCEHQSDGCPWAIYVSSVGNGSDWKLSVGAHDPFIGIPPLNPAEYPVPSSPYVSIEGHQAADAQIFFGRNREIRQLYDWLFNHATEPPILLFYGQSGVGKSSLLRAGLLPRLTKQVSVTYLRRNRDLTEDLHQAIGGTSDDAAIAWLKSETPSLIILDQLEEAITHHDGASSEMTNFIQRLIEIYSICDLKAKRPIIQDSRARLILSFRKEYLAEIRNPLMSGVPTGFPDLARDFWLERLDCDGIEQVVMGPVRSRLLRDTYNLSIPEPDFAVSLANNLDDGNSPIATILQIVLGKLWNAATEAAASTGGKPVYTKELYKRVSTENPLKSFYDQQVAQLGASAGGVEIAKGLELDLLYEHTTNLVTSRRRSFAELRRSYPQVPNLQDLITRNKDLHLLTEPAKEDGSDGAAVPGQVTSLAHDTLATVVRREFELSLQPGARARRILENRARDWTIDKDGDTLDKADLKVVEKGLPQMRSLTAEEQRMLVASRERRRRQRRAMIIGPSVAMVVIAVIFTLTVKYLLDIDDVKTLENRSTVSLNADNQLLALLESLQAANDLRQFRTLRTLPSPTLHAGVLRNLRIALEKTTEVGRYPFNRLAAFEAETCAVAFDRNNHLRFKSVGDTGGTFDGKKVPDFYTGQFSATCDPASGRFAVIQGEKITTWRDGVSAVVDPSRAQSDYAVMVLGLSPAGDKIAVGRIGGAIQIFDLNSGGIQSLQNETEGDVHAIAFSADGALVGAAGDKGLTIWSLPSGQVQPTGLARLGSGRNNLTKLLLGRTPSTPYALVADTLDVGSHPVQLVRISDAGTGVTLYPYGLSIEDKIANAFAINHRGDLLAVGLTDGHVDVWGIPNDLSDPYRVLPASSRIVRDLKVSTRGIYNLAFSQDSRLLATSSWQTDSSSPAPNTVRVWELDLSEEKKAARRSNLNQLFVMGCRRVQIYLDEMSGSPAYSGVDVDLKSLQTGCKAALGLAKSGR